MSDREIITQPQKKNVPIILVPLHQREDQSDNSLFKNDSLSSYQPDRSVPQQHQMSTNLGLPGTDQIRKFLKRGELLNTNTLKKLQQDRQINQIAKHDRSSASLYKPSRYMDYPISEDEKQAEIKRLYLSHRKQPSKLYFRTPLYKPQKSSQEVQTEEQNYYPEIPNEGQQPVSYHPLHKPSYVTIDVNHEEIARKKTFREQTQLEQDLQEDKLLPKRNKKALTVRAKALSNHTNNVNSYVQAMNKQDFSFHNNVSKYSQKYREYRDQETVFSRTIDVKPLRPLKDTLSNFAEQSDFKSQPTTAVFQKNQSGFTQKLAAVSSLKPVTTASKPSPPMRAETRTDKRVKQFVFQKKQVSQVIKEATNERDSSLLPQISNQYNMSSRNRDRQNISEIASRLEAIAPNQEQVSQGRTRIQGRSQLKNASKSKQLKNSILIQVPSHHELKVGQGAFNQSKSIHPIKHAFGASEVDWIHRYYRPKNDFLKEMSSSNFQIKKYQNGVYFGEISSQGHKEGKGAIFYFTGKIFQGQFQNDSKTGVGHEYFPDGSNYKGEFKGGAKHGRGVFEWSNEEVYDGQWQNGKKTGSGMWTSPEGQSYIGEWKGDKVEGFGVFVMKNSSRYEGEFKNSLKHGMGTERFSNGETYVGYYQRNRPNGEGEYYWSNGDYFKGNFSNGLRHGEGYFKEGKTNIEYRGQYQNDKKCGFGEINYSNGLVYTGNFENNFRHGYGELIEKGKLKYRGYWINDNQIDDVNHLPLESDDIRSKGIGVIQEVYERQDTLPKSLPKQQPRPRQTKRQVSVSPEGEDGYKRACGCNRKH